MGKYVLFVFFLIQSVSFANKSCDENKQDSTGKINCIGCQVNQAFEVESLFPMFFYGGYHLAAGYRYENIRIRVSVINGGNYDAEPAGLKNHKDKFKRYYKTSPGIFIGYNIWRNLELYTYVEDHTFEIEEIKSGLRKKLYSIDLGWGVSYQYFIGNTFYIQPGLHVYLRKGKELNFTENYKISSIDLSPIIRIGLRLWGEKD